MGQNIQVETNCLCALRGEGQAGLVLPLGFFRNSSFPRPCPPLLTALDIEQEILDAIPGFLVFVDAALRSQ